METTVDIGNCPSADVDIWERFGLTPLPGATVDAPPIRERQASTECAVEDDSVVGE